MSLLGLMRSFTIRLRMLGAIAIVIALLLTVGGAGLWGMQRLKAVQDEIVHHSLAEAVALGQLELALSEARRFEQRALAAVAAGGPWAAWTGS